jgi:hypothetical protein
MVADLSCGRRCQKKDKGLLEMPTTRYNKRKRLGKDNRGTPSRSSPPLRSAESFAPMMTALRLSLSTSRKRRSFMSLSFTMWRDPDVLERPSKVLLYPDLESELFLSLGD